MIHPEEEREEISTDRTRPDPVYLLSKKIYPPPVILSRFNDWSNKPLDAQIYQFLA